MIEMNIKGLMVDPITNMPIIILRDPEGQKVLPIWVGVFEANAIALQIENIQTPRPMTHDLLRNIIQDLQAAVEKVVVCDLKENTFYAMIYLQTPTWPGCHRRAPERCHRPRPPHARADPGGGEGHRQRQERGLHQREAGQRPPPAVARVARPGRPGKVQDVAPRSENRHAPGDSILTLPFRALPVGRPTIRATCCRYVT